MVTAKPLADRGWRVCATPQNDNQGGGLRVATQDVAGAKGGYNQNIPLGLHDPSTYPQSGAHFSGRWTTKEKATRKGRLSVHSVPV